MLVRALLFASATVAFAQSEVSSTIPDSFPSSTPTTSTSEEPCAVVSSFVAASETAIPAETAFACLNSVPVDIDGNSKLIDELKIVWEWQSEIGWLKNTPPEWEYGPIDLKAELDDIKSNLNSYNSEYEVQLAIQNLTARTGNFHFNYQPDILQIFGWSREDGVVAISEDGTSLPKLYSAVDAARASRENRSSGISEITEINGEGAFAYLEKLAVWEQYIDTDGRLNSVFFKGDTLTPGAFSSQTQYDGSWTTFTFANGTVRSIDNFAATGQNFQGVIDGQSFFQVYCTGAISGSSSKGGPDAKSTLDLRGRLGEHATIPHNNYHHGNHKRQSIPSRLYPTAVIEAESGAVAGYFLNGDGYNDIAVLKIITFAPENDDIGNKFQAVVQQFLAECIAQNKQKLIIDLRQNGGGATRLLLDTFMQLFPTEEPFSGQRYRAQGQFEVIGNAVNEIYSDQALNSSFTEAAGFSIDAVYRYWAWWHFRTAQGDNFESWNEFNEPVTLNSDDFTATVRYNYSNADEVSIRVPGFDFVNTSNLTQPFKASNVVMFTDALCGSSCASFHEELKNIAGIHAVTVGGRPENRPIQTVTGSKGGEVISLNSFPLYASLLLNVSGTIGLSSIDPNAGVLTDLANTSQISTRVGDSSSRLQTQDQIRKGDKTGTPLQYIYEASDCKIFYTLATWANPDFAWKYAWDAFQDDSKCVANSTKHPTSISGGYKPYGPGELKDADEPQGNGTNGTSTPTPTASSPPQYTNAGASTKGNFALAAFAAMIVAALHL